MLAVRMRGGWPFIVQRKLDVRVCVPGCAIRLLPTRSGMYFIILGLNRPGWPLKSRKIDNFLCSQKHTS